MATPPLKSFHILTLLVVLITSLGTAPVFSGALHCDGIDDFAIIPDAAGDYDPLTSVTVEAWIRLDSYSDLGSAVSGFSGSLALGQGQFADSGKPVFTISVPATDSAVGTTDIPLSTWTHLAGTFDGTDIKVYVDGVLAGTEGHPGTASSLSEVRLCRFPVGTANFMQGAIDEVRWWNTVRTEAQIADNRGVILNGDEPGLVGYWRFEGLGQDILDSSVQGNDGFLGAADTAGDDDPTRLQENAPVFAPEPESAPIPTMGYRGIVFLVLVISALGIVAGRRLI